MLSSKADSGMCVVPADNQSDITVLACTVAISKGEGDEIWVLDTGWEVINLKTGKCLEVGGDIDGYEDETLKEAKLAGCSGAPK